MTQKRMTYAGAGVSYDDMDPFKRMAQLVARETAGNIAGLNNGDKKVVIRPVGLEYLGETLAVR